MTLPLNTDLTHGIDWPLRTAREAIRDAIEARHPETPLLEYVETLDPRETLARALILAAGAECDDWLCPVAKAERSFGAAADRAWDARRDAA